MGALLSGLDEKRIPVNVDAGGSGKWVEYTLMANRRALNAARLR